MPQKIFLCSSFDDCEGNVYLTSQIYEFFIQNSYTVLNGPSLADTIIISTCGFDKVRESSALRLIKSLAGSYAKKKKIFVCGCLPAISAELANYEGIELVGSKDIARFNNYFRHTIPIENIKANKLNPRFLGTDFQFAGDYYIQIASGCVNHCTYCIIKKAKGAVVSKPLPEVLSEFREGLANGFTRFVLLADDCGSYGVDLGTDLADLLNQAVQLSPLIEVNIHYVYPNKLLELYPKLDPQVFKQMYHLNISLQTASSRILALMGRSYDISAVLNMIRNIRVIRPDIYIKTHLIYAFPTETREEFEATFSLREYFDKIVYLYYTDRENTPASKLAGKLGPTEVMSRTAQLVVKEMVEKDQIIELGYQENKNVFTQIAFDIIVPEIIDVLLIYPLSSEDKTNYLPLGLVSLAQPLMAAGLTVKILDQRLESDLFAELDQVLSQKTLLCIGMSCYSGPQINSVIDIARYVKSKSDVPIVLGGSHPTIMPHQTLEHPDIDMVIRGEGEKSFLALALALKHQTPLEDVAGISFKADARITHNPDAPLIDLNDYNYLPYYLVEKYKTKYLPQMQTSRGCPGSCTFCIIPLLAMNKYRARTPENVVKEIKFLQESMDVRELFCIDDNFITDTRRLEQIVDQLSVAIAAGQLKYTPLLITGRVDNLLKFSPKFITELVRVGVAVIFVGAESGSNTTLRRIHKQHTREMLIEVNNLFKYYPIELQFSFMVFPFESESELQATTELIEQLKADNSKSKIWRLNSYCPYPGTQLFAELQDSADVPKQFSEWSNFDWDRSFDARPANPQSELVLTED